MLSVVIRNPTASQKVFGWIYYPLRCRASALMGVCGRSVTSSSSQRDCSQARTPRCVFYQSHSLVLERKQYLHCTAVRLKKRLQPEPPPRELDLVRYDMKNLWEGPKAALCLGFAGLVPFIFPTLLMAATELYYPQLGFAQVAYGASIVSFLGGARWGFALPDSSPAKADWINLANSVVPSLLAWGAMLMSDSIVPAATMVIMGLGVSLHYDLSLLPTYPSWFKALRTVLTAVAFFSLLGTLILKGVFPEKDLF